MVLIPPAPPPALHAVAFSAGTSKTAPVLQVAGNTWNIRAAGPAPQGGLGTAVASTAVYRDGVRRNPPVKTLRRLRRGQMVVWVRLGRSGSARGPSRYLDIDSARQLPCCDGPGPRVVVYEDLARFDGSALLLNAYAVQPLTRAQRAQLDAVLGQLRVVKTRRGPRLSWCRRLEGCRGRPAGRHQASAGPARPDYPQDPYSPGRD